MAAILADDSFNCIFLNENVRISIQFSLKFVLKGPIDNISALVLVMVCRLLPEPMVTQFTNTYMWQALGGDELR